MTADALTEALGYGVLIPAVVSVGIVWLTQRLLPEDAATRFPTAAGFAGGFFVGYLLLPEWAELFPTRHWHWLPYLGLAAGLTGPIGLAKGVSLPERWLLTLMLAIVAAALLVPIWSRLQPTRAAWLSVVTAWLFLLAALSDPLPPRIGGRRLTFMLWLVSVVVAVTIALSVSVTYGRVAVVAAGSLAGVCAGAWWGSDDSETRALIPAFTVIVGGIAFVGFIEPDPPLFGLLALPVAPLSLWVCRIGPLKRLSGVKAATVQFAAVLVPLGIAAALTIGS